jgi:hypothetical protein
MTPEDQKSLLASIGSYVRSEIAKAIEPLLKRIAELESRGVEYKGTFQRGNTYKRGDLCTYDGSLWCAVSDTKALDMPGECPAWVLAVKSSANGRVPTKGRT